jgi:hypothetical protein
MRLAVGEVDVGIGPRDVPKQGLCRVAHDQVRLTVLVDKVAVFADIPAVTAPAGEAVAVVPPRMLPRTRVKAVSVPTIVTTHTTGTSRIG